VDVVAVAAEAEALAAAETLSASEVAAEVIIMDLSGKIY
jgi:hypothetical protein